jgi:hypothetical protein
VANPKPARTYVAANSAESTSNADAQKSPDFAALSSAGTEQTTASTAVPDEPSWLSYHDAMLISMGVLVFGLAVILISAAKMKKDATPNHVLQLFGMLTTIVLAVFLITTGYTGDQIAPVVGLLGTLAGYMVGRGVSSEIEDTKQPAQPAATAPLLPSIKSGA